MTEPSPDKSWSEEFGSTEDFPTNASDFLIKTYALIKQLVEDVAAIRMTIEGSEDDEGEEIPGLADQVELLANHVGTFDEALAQADKEGKPTRIAAIVRNYLQMRRLQEVEDVANEE